MKKEVENMEFYNAKLRAIAKIIGIKGLIKLIKILGTDVFSPSATLTHERKFMVMTDLYNGHSENYCVTHTGTKSGTVAKYNIIYKAYQSS